MSDKLFIEPGGVIAEVFGLPVRCLPGLPCAMAVSNDLTGQVVTLAWDGEVTDHRPGSSVALELRRQFMLGLDPQPIRRLSTGHPQDVHKPKEPVMLNERDSSTEAPVPTGTGSTESERSSVAATAATSSVTHGPQPEPLTDYQRGYRDALVVIALQLDARADEAHAAASRHDDVGSEHHWRSTAFNDAAAKARFASADPPTDPQVRR